MIPTIIAFPLIGALVLFQSAVVSKIPLLHGTADLVMLVLIAWALQKRVRKAWIWSLVGGVSYGFISALPFGIPLLGYLSITGLVLAMRQFILQYSILAMLTATFLGTIFFHAISIVALILSGSILPLMETLNKITLPSLILNLVLAVPIHTLIKDLAELLHPEEVEI